MKKPLLALLFLVSLVAVAPAQDKSPDAVRSEEIMKKVTRLDSLIQIVPLALTKDQYGPLLTVIEKVHQKQKELYAQEAKDLGKLDAKLTKTVDDGIGKEIYPPREVQNEVAATMRAMGIRRGLFYNEMVDLVYDVCKKTLNEGQLKTMEKSLKPELLGSPVKGEDMDEATRIKFFVRKILLEPAAYDILLEMSRKRKDDSGA